MVELKCTKRITEIFFDEPKVFFLWHRCDKHLWDPLTIDFRLGFGLMGIELVP